VTARSTVVKDSASRNFIGVPMLAPVNLPNPVSSKNRICVIYNPMARGGRAQRMRTRLEALGADCSFLPTDAPGAAITLATEAIEKGFETIVASGGDGTLNEVVNGIANAPDGLNRARLGLMPLGTVNVFAKELCYPVNLERAWRTILRGTEKQIDLGCAEFLEGGEPRKRYFVQLGGAGLDARAIQLVEWKEKQRVGQLAYIFAGLRALREPQPAITCETEHREHVGKLVLLGSGRFYGGMVPVFPQANLTDGKLHACVFEKLNLWVFVRYAMGFISGNVKPPSSVRYLQSKEFKLYSKADVPFELEGDLIGRLPATFSVCDQRIRVIVP
jgi:diacylglycerol kinase (ATP)